MVCGVLLGRQQWRRGGARYTKLRILATLLLPEVVQFVQFPSERRGAEKEDQNRARICVSAIIK